MEVFSEITFEAAHCLPNLPEGHKCRRLHGHSFRVAIFVRGPIDVHAGWVMDFGEIKAAFEPLRCQLDHSYLNEIAGLENPTSEILAKWIWQHLQRSLPSLCKVMVNETCDSGCVYCGEVD